MTQVGFKPKPRRLRADLAMHRLKKGLVLSFHINKSATKCKLLGGHVVVVFSS